MTKSAPVPSEVGGYILAGGKSSRMGTDKALLELAGKPLIAHAVNKLRRICMDVRILSGDSALAGFAPLVPDLHPGCGPIAGIEAALAHSFFDWNVFLPVDIPLIPTAFLDSWVRGTLAVERRGVRIAMFTVDGVQQPTLAMIHREAAPYIAESVARGEYKLFSALEFAGRELASREALLLRRVFSNAGWSADCHFRASTGRRLGQPWETTSDAQEAARPLWFANLNTPQEFAAVEAHTAALDT